MRALIELALEATGKAERLLQALESNPSRLVLINAFILFEELLKAELMRCRGYTRQMVDVSFPSLMEMAKTEFRAKCQEPWTLLDNLSKVRNCAAGITRLSLPFGAIIPSAIRDRFSAESLNAPCLDFLQPRLAETWRFLTQFTYMQVFYSIRTVAQKAGEAELAGDFRKMIEYVVEYLNGPDGSDILEQVEDTARRAQPV